MRRARLILEDILHLLYLAGPTSIPRTSDNRKLRQKVVEYLESAKHEVLIFTEEFELLAYNDVRDAIEKAVKDGVKVVVYNTKMPEEKEKGTAGDRVHSS